MLAVLFDGCATLRRAPPEPGPVFTADPEDLERYGTLGRRQERLLETCSATGSCAYLHFSRGLVGLFEDRASARRHFVEVAALAPESRLADSSRLWLELIDEQERPNIWNQLLEHLQVSSDGFGPRESSLERLVRDLLEREIVIQHLLYRSKRDAATLEVLKGELMERGKELERLITERDALEAKVDGATTPAIERLQRHIAIRDQKIKELNNQLDALKRIDQEMRQKVRPVTPVPLPHPASP